MNYFEIVMLVCFGASWPLSLVKTIRAKNPAGKSLMFMYLILLGYLSGGLNKLYVKWDDVFWLYMFNGLMVATDIALTHYYLYKNRKM
jgi:hypothetical protein